MTLISIPIQNIIPLGPDCSVRNIKRAVIGGRKCMSVCPLESVWTYDPCMPAISPAFGSGQVVAALIKNDFRGFADDLVLSHRGKPRSRIYPIEFSHFRNRFESVEPSYSLLIKKFIRDMTNFERVVFVMGLRVDYMLSSMPFINSFANLHCYYVKHLMDTIKERYPHLEFSLIHITYVKTGVEIHQVYADAIDLLLSKVPSCLPKRLVVAKSRDAYRPEFEQWRTLASEIFNLVSPSP